MDISIVIPLLNEEGSLKELNHWIASVMQSNGFSYEVLYIDDGSTDNSWPLILEMAGSDEHVKGIRFQKNFGKNEIRFAGKFKSIISIAYLHS